MESEPKFLKGTTTVGLVCSDGVILAADRRASMGTLIASKQAKKIHRINDRIGVTIAGSVGDADAMIRMMKAEASLFEMNNKKIMSTKAAATLMANILQGSKYYPYMIQLLVAGIDEEASLYTLDPLGGLIKEEMASTGSGSPVAYGVLELDYTKNRTVDETIPLALRALGSALKRDCATGDGVSLVTITKEGYREFNDEEIAERLAAGVTQ